MNEQDPKQVIITALHTLVLVFAFLIAALLIFSSCGVTKPVQPAVIIRDSVVYRDRVVVDTAIVEVPKVVEKIVTRDTVSHLENEWAKSDASVYDGFLEHSLESIPRTIYVPVQVMVTDTLIVQKEAETIVETVEVEKELTWWQNFRMRSFWWLFAAAAGLLVWVFRKPISALIKGIL